MAEQVKQEPVAAQAEREDSEDEENTPGYKAPAPKSMNEIVQMDQEDESLKKYKKALLGDGGGDCLFPDDPRKVILKNMCLEVEGRPAIELDLTKKLEEIKKTNFTLKEGSKYKLKIDFYVQREIVSGLRYFHAVYRKGIKVDKFGCMVGSYGPSKTAHSFTTTEEEAPSGLITRGDYKIKSKFIDDDKNTYLEWEWTLCIKKDWD